MVISTWLIYYVHMGHTNNSDSKPKDASEIKTMKHITVKHPIPCFDKYEDQVYVEFEIEYDETDYSKLGHWTCQLHFNPKDDTLAHQIKTVYRNRMSNGSLPSLLFPRDEDFIPDIKYYTIRYYNPKGNTTLGLSIIDVLNSRTLQGNFSWDRKNN